MELSYKKRASSLSFITTISSHAPSKGASVYRLSSPSLRDVLNDCREGFFPGFFPHRSRAHQQRLPRAGRPRSLPLKSSRPSVPKSRGSRGRASKIPAAAIVKAKRSQEETSRRVPTEKKKNQSRFFRVKRNCSCTMATRPCHKRLWTKYITE